ncbi:putative HhH-GPD domain, endonuclease III-like, iron-sulfur cluster loop, DNA glycosylase [Helianthus anomalus]
MSFEKEFQIPHGNRDYWSSVTHGMPIPHENGIGHGEGSRTTVRSGIELVGVGDPTLAPGRLMRMDNGSGCDRGSWNATTESTILQRNGIGQSGNSWFPVTSETQINERANPVPVEMHENRSETENWGDLLGMYTDLLQEKTLDTNEILGDNNRQPPPVVCNNGNQNWVASNRNLTQTLNHVAYQNQTPNQATTYNTSLTSMLGGQQTQRFTSNILISNGHNPKDGFPVNYQPRYSPGSPPRWKPDAAASRIVDSFPFAPITPDNQRKHMDGQRVPEKVNFSDEETSARAKNRHGNQTVLEKDAENLYNELLQTIEKSPPSAVSTTQKDNIISEDKDEGTDVHKTPNQKTPTRRRKHRPKVIREGKPKRTPKVPINGEIRVKRKYVRRKSVNNLNENTPAEIVQKRKYVRKKGVNSSNDKNPTEPVQKRKYMRKKGVDHLESQQQKTVDDTPPVSCKKRLNFDLESVTQDEGHDSKSIQQDINVPSTPVKARYHDLNVLARHMTTSPKQDTGENGYSNTVNELVHGNEIKNYVFQAGMRPANMQRTPQSFTIEGMVSLDEKRGIKRQSCEQRSYNVNAMNSVLWYQKMLLGVANRANNCNPLSNILLENHKRMKMQGELQDSSRQTKGIYINGPTNQLLNSCTGRSDPAYKVISYGGNGDNHQFRRPMAATHYLLKRQLSNGMLRPHMMRSMLERSQRYTQGAMISWNQNRASRFAVTAYPKVEPNSYNQRLIGLNEKLQQHRNNSLKLYQQSTRRARGRPRKQKVEFSVVDEITYKLERLCIYDGNKKQQNELVLHRGSEAIIPFEPIRKRNQRPKVDLDPESERLWNLLMGDEGSKGAENMDNEKEKWWENERRVFRGRTDSFIARMHLVQGDRRFSRWKGSVVDSVIGVFLTQNVSDHLSSSAFMALAAKFPVKSTTADKTCCQDDNIKCHDKITTPSNSSENMTQLEEEVILSQDSFDTSTIQTVNECGSSSGSNSEADDVTTGFETSKQSGTPQKDHSSNDDLAKNMHHPPKEPACNIQISSTNGIDMNTSSGQFRTSMTPGLHSSNSGVTEACHTSNVTYPQNKIPKFQTPSQSPKEVPTMFGGIPIINVEDRTSVVNKQNCVENTVTEANSREPKVSHVPLSGSGQNMPKAKKETPEDERKKTIDWDSLRKEALSNGEKKERSENAKDTIDYEALRRANVNEISDAIKERGMNNLLADRMQDFLNRLVRDHGSIDLEWLRDAPPDKAKDYLLSFRGLGLKSVECVRLLTLHHLAFPVDTNVGRIAVRLGWVPLQPLPESLQLHLLEMYPVLESIQKYLWPRLCKLDQLTLYELHYQMITFGKVFCTKSKPNCNACPMRAECRHFASAFASARLALPGPEEKRIVVSDAPVTKDPISPTGIRLMSLPPAENESHKSAENSGNNCEPIIEEPTTPEPEVNELSISDIEDQYYEDSDDIPSIKLNMEEFTTNLQNMMQDGNDMSKALVALNPKVASIPTPKLKDVSRLRTEHLVYELPDSHQLLEGLDKREPDDPSPYLLAIWTPGETANSVQAPTTDCLAQQSGQLCDRTTCFSCNSIKEANSQVVRGTILIPCRTAMRGSFPLNGTYFQVNEMFADHASSLNPIDVPRTWIWNLPRRKVYFGTSVSTIFKGLTTEGIQYCFWKGFVCVRGFDRINRAPRPLMARLHFPASKLITQKTKANK